MKKFKIVAFLAALLLLIQTGMPMQVFAADGKLSIAVSARTVNVGDTVTVTLSAAGPNNEKATADMEFTYNTSTFSFESCGAPGYTGGAGGTVKASGGMVTVKLKAIAEGDCGLKVTGSNGKIKASGEGLSKMVAAGVVIQAGAGTASTGSSDNSLSALSLSAGELSPAFVYSTTSYVAEVPYETTSVDVNATPSHSNAKVESITGNTDLQVGENTISVTVTAENGSKAVYKIVVTRAAEPTGTIDPGADPGADPGTDPSGQDTTDSQIEEYQDQITYWKNQYMKQYEKNESQKSFSRKVIAVLIFAVVVLAIVCINLLLFKRRQNAGSGEDIFPVEKKPARESHRRRHPDPDDVFEPERSVKKEAEAFEPEPGAKKEAEAFEPEQGAKKEAEAFEPEQGAKKEAETTRQEESNFDRKQAADTLKSSAGDETEDWLDEDDFRETHETREVKPEKKQKKKPNLPNKNSDLEFIDLDNL